jgi:hypothetical protein
VLVTGDRNWSDRDRIYSVLDGIHTIKHITYIIHGCARGADTLASAWATERGVAQFRYPADWNRYGKAAGVIRNAEMLEHHPDLVVAFHSDLEHSKGTKDMVNRAVEAYINVILVSKETTEARWPER